MKENINRKQLQESISRDKIAKITKKIMNRETLTDEEDELFRKHKEEDNDDLENTYRPKH
jgi:hypothetical protein